MSSRIRRIRKVPTLPSRATDAHKGSFGRVLVVGGSRGMLGAPALVGLSALRSGAGLVTLAVPESIQPATATLCPCATSVPLPQTPAGQIDPAGARGAFSGQGLPGNKPAAAPPDVLVIGPGVGQGSKAYGRQLWDLIDAFRLGAGVPAVIDADALNLAPRPSPQGRRGWDRRPHPGTVVTPHPGELARMCAVSAADVQADRRGYAVRTAERLNACVGDDAARAVVVLKGAGTIVTDGRKFYVNDTGNPGMATGGSGDVLTGVIAALIGQGMDGFDAAVLGVHVHGLAGDLAARRVGQVSLIATDVIDALPAAFSNRGRARKG